uniref:hypothetical protein n=1 Tax=Trebonia sp. TaxID=2767075 RepID=UPI00261490A2
MSALHLADGPAMYFGGTIMSFALPLGAFIVITTALFFLYRRPHHGPRLKYLTPEVVASLQTWEPGPVSAPAARAARAPEAAAPGAPGVPEAPGQAAQAAADLRADVRGAAVPVVAE